MNKTSYCTMFAALMAATLTAVGPARPAEPDAAAQRQAELVAVLLSDATPDAEKAITCKRLAIYGDAEAVPALAPLLADERLCSWARIALEAIPGPEADAALRDAMDKVKGRQLIGVINSIGVRRDANAVDMLAARLNDADAEVASAAAAALGRIGSAPATAALEQALARVPAAVRSAVAEGCVLCAEELLAAGNREAAAKLYDKVRQADVPKQRIVEATRGAILARQAAGVPLLIEQLESPDRAMFAIGLQTVRELPGREATEALVAALDKASPSRRALIVFALADRDDPSVLPAMLEAAADGATPVRLAAVGMLSRVGDASCVPVLLDIALEEDEALADAAKTALEQLPGEAVDAHLVARLGTSESAVRRVLIEVAGRRRIAAAVPALLKAADDSDPAVRAAALTALGSAAGPGDLAVLISRVVEPEEGDDVQAAAEALHAACIRMPDREATAAQLTAAMAKAPLPGKVAILEVLGAMGGPRALATVGAAAQDPSPELQDAATRLLGDWMSVDAAPVLLGVAKSRDSRYQVRALRGYIRLVRQFNVPDPERVAMCRAALEAATRDEERALVLEVMERYPSVDMLKLAVDAGKMPALKNDAARVALSIAQKIGGDSVDVETLLAQLGQEPIKLEIVKAEYGANGKYKDVTDVVQRAVRGLPLILLPSSSYNSAFGGDPAPGIVKELKIQYRMNGKAGEATFPENATILLPAPK